MTRRQRRKAKAYNKKKMSELLRYIDERFARIEKEWKP